MRKIVQLSTCRRRCGDVEADSLFALCDDGTVWQMVEEAGPHEARKWARQPSLPQS